MASSSSTESESEVIMLEDLSSLSSKDTDELQEGDEVEPPKLHSLLSSSKCFRRTPETDYPLVNGCDDNWTWNVKAKSHEVRLYGPKCRIAHFHPNWSNGTAGVRGTRILNKGRYYWELNVSQRIFGTSMMFGIGTKNASLHRDAFVNMLGEGDGQSWGLSHKGLLWHDGKHTPYTKSFKENNSTTIGLYFDGIAGTLTYYKDGINLGIAFHGLADIEEPLYPIICSTAAKTEMALGVTKREFYSIQDRCRSVIIKHLSREDQIDQLELPRTLKRFISEGLSEESQEDIDLTKNNLS